MPRSPACLQDAVVKALEQHFQALKGPANLACPFGTLRPILNRYGRSSLCWRLCGYQDFR